VHAGSTDVAPLMFVRVFILIVLIAIVVTVVRRLRARAQSPAAGRIIDGKAVRCARCQVYFPSHEAVVRDGDSFCSQAHADAGRAQT
jgi:hypothetical protein